MTLAPWIIFATLALFNWGRWRYDVVVIALPLILIFWPFAP
jgi:hypothetical protein